MKNTTCTYQHSAMRSEEVEEIRKKYLPVKESMLDKLRMLDRRVQSAGKWTGLSLGIIGCLVFGIGMCFGLDTFSGPDWLSVLFGMCGALIMALAYPVYKRIANKTRAALSPEILALSDELINV